MRTVKTIKTLRKLIVSYKLKGRTIGFVPTMGALHEGHLSLLKKCRKENDIVVLSAFVNPTQFAPHENFRSYPRNKLNDKVLAKNAKVDIIFQPSDVEMRSEQSLISISVDPNLTNGMCGMSRPGHFEAVATVVSKLLNIVTPEAMYLGMKDAQQLVVLKRMVEELNFPVTIRACPTIREKDGLALSSRNVNLKPKQKFEAPVLYQSLKEAKMKILAGNKNPLSIIAYIHKRITLTTSGKIDYIACVNASTLMPLKKIKGNVMLALAVKFGKTRLIDNINFTVK